MCAEPDKNQSPRILWLLCKQLKLKAGTEGRTLLQGAGRIVPSRRPGTSAGNPTDTDTHIPTAIATSTATGSWEELKDTEAGAQVPKIKRSPRFLL